MLKLWGGDEKNDSDFAEYPSQNADDSAENVVDAVTVYTGAALHAG